jgi:diaminopimelate decarboxylase
MADNIRPALYGAQYAVALANRDPQGDQLLPVTIAGKYCESGDVLIQDAMLPALDAGDLLAVPMTGAYCLSMASNYNLAPRPAVVLVREGRAHLIRRRESYQDLLRSDLSADSVDSSMDPACLSVGKRSL